LNLYFFKVFDKTPAGKRKIVVATNSAETSLTIDGICIVIDSGMVKEPSFDPDRNMTTLDVKLVSQSSAKQRTGRAGTLALLQNLRIHLGRMKGGYG
jgi:HrpA-like RNA helicase